MWVAFIKKEFIGERIDMATNTEKRINENLFKKY